MVGLIMDGESGVERIGVIVVEGLVAVTGLVDVGASLGTIEEEVGIVVIGFSMDSRCDIAMIGSCDTRCTGMNVKVRKTRNKDQVPREKP